MLGQPIHRQRYAPSTPPRSLRVFTLYPWVSIPIYSPAATPPVCDSTCRGRDFSCYLSVDWSIKKAVVACSKDSRSYLRPCGIERRSGLLATESKEANWNKPQKILGSRKRLDFGARSATSACQSSMLLRTYSSHHPSKPRLATPKAKV